MVAYTASRAGVTKPSAAAGWAVDSKRAWGSFEYGASAAIAAADTIVMCKLPKGAAITGGYLQGDQIDSQSTGSFGLSINIGLDKAVVFLSGSNSGTTVTSSSTSNALASQWSLGPDAAVSSTYKPDNAVRNVPLGSLLLTDGPLLTTDETNVYITVRASATGITTGTLTLLVDYYQHQHA